MRVIAMNTNMHFAAASAACVALLLWATAPLNAQNQYPFQNASLPLEQRVDNILSLMTLDEKLACLATSTAVPRLHIPDAGGSEGLHGLVRKGDFNQKAVTTTQFPEVIGMASTWDPALIRRAGAVQGYEARYIYQTRSTRVACWWCGDPMRTWRATRVGEETTRAMAKTRSSPERWPWHSSRGCKATTPSIGRPLP